MFVDCDQDVVQEVAGKLISGAGPFPVDGITPRKWILNSRTASHMLNKEMVL
jgi:hypothetical protein